MIKFVFHECTPHTSVQWFHQTLRQHRQHLHPQGSLSMLVNDNGDLWDPLAKSDWLSEAELACRIDRCIRSDTKIEIIKLAKYTLD